jgi:2-oxoglutarate/2-oxoacid ferredoxin oxidoreductase subunit alpha
MKADPAGVLTGSHYLDGDHAICEGALAAGCRFVAGYPITPSTEVVERISGRFPKVGGIFIQMEDEIASSIAILGGSWAGRKSMTVTSGPGFSLMMEHIGLAAMMEVPVVFVNVQRGGPSTGLPTLTGQADMMQARWGSHGDYEVIALAPSSPQEGFWQMIKAFNLAETYRVPVMLMTDECVGHMIERVDIPPAEEIEVSYRKCTEKKPGEYWPYQVEDEDLIPPFAPAGEGHRYHTTGLTHDYRGYPVINAECQKDLVQRLIDKIDKNRDKIVDYSVENVDDADVVVVAYGITHRVATRGVQLAREKGLRVGQMKLNVVWPLPEQYLIDLVEKQGKKIVFPEINMGQVVLEVQRLVGKNNAISIPHTGGTVHKPEDILAVIEEVAK